MFLGSLLKTPATEAGSVCRAERKEQIWLRKRRNSFVPATDTQHSVGIHCLCPVWGPIASSQADSLQCPSPLTLANVRPASSILPPHEQQPQSSDSVAGSHPTAPGHSTSERRIVTSLSSPDLNAEREGGWWWCKKTKGLLSQ